MSAPPGSRSTCSGTRMSSHMRREIARAAGGGRGHARAGRRACGGAGRRRARARARPRRAGRARHLRPRRDLRPLPARGALRALGEPGGALALHDLPPAGRSLAGARAGCLPVGPDAGDRGRAGVRGGRGALTAALTNEAGSPLADAVAHALVTAAGEEQSVAATKTFTTALAAIAELARALGAGDLAAGARGAAGSARSGGGAARRARRVGRSLAARCRGGGLHLARLRLRDGARGGAQAQGGHRALGRGLQRGRPAPRSARGRARAARRSSSTRAARSPATSTGWSASSPPPARRSSRSARAARCRPPAGCARSSPRSR